MTVEELIKKLERIKDKSKVVMMDCGLEEEYEVETYENKKDYIVLGY